MSLFENVKINNNKLKSNLHLVDNKKLLMRNVQELITIFLIRRTDLSHKVLNKKVVKIVISETKKKY